MKKPVSPLASLVTYVPDAPVVTPTDYQSSPEAVAEDQRRDVSRAWRTHRQGTVDERVKLVSEEVMLDGWTVRRRLRELGYDVPDSAMSPDERVIRAKGKTAAILKALAAIGGEATAVEIARQLGLDKRAVIPHLYSMRQRRLVVIKNPHLVRDRHYPKTWKLTVRVSS